MQLQEKASALMNQSPDGSHTSMPPADVLDDEGKVIDELAIFGGQTQILFSKRLSQKTPNRWIAREKLRAINTPLEQPGSLDGSGILPGLSTAPASQSPISQGDSNMQNVHPSMEYMSMLSSTALSYDDAVDQPLQDQPNVNGIAEASQFFKNSTVPNSFHQKSPLEYSTHQPQPQPLVVDFNSDPILIFPQFHQETSSRSAPEGSEDHNVTTNDPPTINFMDDQWMRLFDWDGAVARAASNRT